MKAIEIIRGLNEQRKGNISKAFDQASPDRYFEKLENEKDQSKES